jgi:hypothetical protein
MLAGQRINADDVTSAYRFIFKLQRRKICTVLYNNIHRHYFRVEFLTSKKSLSWGGGHQCKMQTSLYSGSILKSTVLFPTSYWLRPFPKYTLFSTLHAHISCTISIIEDDIGTMEALSVWHNNFHYVL